MRLNIAEARFYPVHVCVLDIQPLKAEAIGSTFHLHGMDGGIYRQTKGNNLPLQTRRDMRLIECGRDRAQPFEWARSFSFPFQIVKHEVDED